LFHLKRLQDLPLPINKGAWPKRRRRILETVKPEFKRVSKE